MLGSHADQRMYQLARLVELRGIEYVHNRLTSCDPSNPTWTRGLALRPPTYSNAWHELHTSSEEGNLSTTQDTSDDSHDLASDSTDERYHAQQVAQHYGVPGHQEDPYPFEDAWRGHDHENYYEDPRHWEV